VRSVDIVLEGADNFATKFLCADPLVILEGAAVVHGAAVRWQGHGPLRVCKRSPVLPLLVRGICRTGAAAPNCAEAGVLGPVVGLAGAHGGPRAVRVCSASARTSAAC